MDERKLDMKTENRRLKKEEWIQRLDIKKEDIRLVTRTEERRLKKEEWIQRLKIEDWRKKARYQD